ncbi:MAG: hypothetical protein CM1200mP26_06410 [Acidimicrobiales bacterium]|nr:MAG: hypothetical protein CM1200mP26_06410 [Acidimicrobiales bacterium]
MAEPLVAESGDGAQLSVERRDDGVVVATLGRPKVNALDTGLLHELGAFARSCIDDPPGAVVFFRRWSDVCRRCRTDGLC